MTSTTPTTIPASRGRRNLSKAVNTKNLRAISLSLVQKLRSAKNGIQSAAVANQLAKDAVTQLVGTDKHATESHKIAIEKNIRRRLYDCLKVLVSIGAITKSKNDKMLYWRGVTNLLPQKLAHSPSDYARWSLCRQERDKLSRSVTETRKRLGSKTIALRQLTQQKDALELLYRRNQSNAAPAVAAPADTSPRIALPFVLLSTPQNTEIMLESTPDTRMMSFRFSDKFRVLHDASIVARLFSSPVPSPLPRGMPCAEGRVVDGEAMAEPCLDAVAERLPAVEPIGPLTPNNDDRSTPSQQRSVASFATPHASPPRGIVTVAVAVAAAAAAGSTIVEVLPPHSPKRRRLPSTEPSPFAKFTSGDKPPPSPARPVPRKRLRTRKLTPNDLPPTLVSPFTPSTPGAAQPLAIPSQPPLLPMLDDQPLPLPPPPPPPPPPTSLHQQPALQLHAQSQTAFVRPPSPSMHASRYPSPARAADALALRTGDLVRMEELADAQPHGLASPPWPRGAAFPMAEMAAVDGNSASRSSGGRVSRVPPFARADGERLAGARGGGGTPMDALDDPLVSDGEVALRSAQALSPSTSPFAAFGGNLFIPFDGRDLPARALFTE